MIGKVLAGRYELQEKIGEGGMATVYRALDRNTKKHVAVKLLREELTQDEAFVERFESEATAAARMTHPNVVSLLDTGIEDGLRYLVIEYVSGTSLKEIIQKTGALRPDIASNITIRILTALAHAHEQGIIHRDIKPQNILLDKQNVIKVLDFGIARVVGQPGDPNVRESAVGSVHYFSPEQARGELADEKSDLYSVGVVLYEMLTGKQPFPGANQVAVAMSHLEDKPKPPHEINANVTPALSQVVMRAMEKRPEKRFHDAASMIKAIRLAMHFPFSAQPTPVTSDLPTPEELRKQTKRLKFYRKLLTTSFTALLFVVIILLIGIVMRNVLRNVLDKVILPNVTNMSYDAAYTFLDNQGLKVRRTDRIVEIGTEGLVVAQSPPPGELLSPGAEVTLTVSVSEFDLIMPDLSQLSEAEAKEKIRESNLVAGMSEKVASEAREGLVIGHTPIPGDKVKYGQVVLLKVSGGLVVMPNFVGKTELEAMSNLPNQLTMEVPSIKTVNDSQLDGIIIDQSPAAYERLTVGSSFTLTVGRLETRVFTGFVNTRLDLSKDALVKAILRLDDGTEEMQYCAIHPKGESDAEFIVRADTPGEYILLMYVEDSVAQVLQVIID